LPNYARRRVPRWPLVGRGRLRLVHNAGERLDADIAFLARHGVDEALLRRAADRAAEHRTTAAEELIALGFESRQYWSLLAADLGLAFFDDLSDATPLSNVGLLTTDAVRFSASALIKLGDATHLVLAPGADEIVAVGQRLQASPRLAQRIAIAAPETIRSFLASHRHPALTHYAVNRLVRVLPHLSSGRARQRGVAGHKALAAAFIALALVAPVTALNAIWLLLTLFFLNCSYWKLLAAFRRVRALRVEPVSDGQLPRYSVLVPLYREAAVVPELVAHLAALDYPETKFEILLIVEEDDCDTRRAVAQAASHALFHVIVVPPGGPRTKPKALTYALAFARGDNVVVFDAEDRPEPDQLRRAAATFRERPELGCVQARLAADNEDSWLARMFTVEYAANFEVVLPALADWRVPLPLGGTSNHFPRAVLEHVGAWDPYNVTEDADLGIRLARFGYPSATVYARTYEEAPVTFRQWLPQRRRWIKGWIQTVALCLGRDIAPSLRLPLRQRLAVHGVLSAGVLGLLLYPISLGLIAAAVVAGLNGRLATGILSNTLLAFSLGNAVAILIASVVSALRGIFAARVPHLAGHILLLPFYWALMSLAAWQALFQYWKQPFSWEKTLHGVARDRRVRRREHF
jgi:cellulose synthase/poly-beta-1,6-N-acetylglucosamine synthase-like glycosyltransferase